MCVFTADQFKLDIRKLVSDNLALFDVESKMTYKYQTTLSADEMRDTLRVVQNVTQGLLGTVEKRAQNAAAGAIEPYFVCDYFDAGNKRETVTCNQTILNSKNATYTWRSTCTQYVLRSQRNGER